MPLFFLNLILELTHENIGILITLKISSNLALKAVGGM
jgi:hypothetical protein